MTIIENLMAAPSADQSAVPSHWDRRRAAVGRKIEIAALTLFLERGPENVSVEAIAEAAGLSRRTFFRYFRTKEEVLVAMPARAMVSASAAFCQRPAEESLIAALIATARNIRFSAEEEALMRMSQQVMLQFPALWMRAVGELRRAMDSNYQAMISFRLRLTGRDDSGAGVIAAGLAAAVVYLYTEWVNEGSSGEFADRLADGLRYFEQISQADITAS